VDPEDGISNLTFTNYRFYSADEGPSPVTLNGSIRTEYWDDVLDGSLRVEHSGPVRTIQFQRFDPSGGGRVLVNNSPWDSADFAEVLYDSYTERGDCIDVEMEALWIFYACLRATDTLQWQDGTAILGMNEGDLPPPGARVSNDEGSLTIEANKNGVIEHFTAYVSDDTGSFLPLEITGDFTIALEFSRGEPEALVFDGALKIKESALVSSMQFRSCKIINTDDTDDWDSWGKVEINGKANNFKQLLFMLASL
jgi:hypothetical protein